MKENLDRMDPDTSVYPDLNDILSYTPFLEKPKLMPGKAFYKFNSNKNKTYINSQ